MSHYIDTAIYLNNIRIALEVMDSLIREYCDFLPADDAEKLDVQNKFAILYAAFEDYQSACSAVTVKLGKRHLPYEEHDE